MLLRPARVRPRIILTALAAACLAGLATIGTTVPADAYGRKVTRACKYDYKRLCPRYPVGSSKMRACMEAKVSEISSRCYEALLDSGEGSRRGRRRR